MKCNNLIKYPIIDFVNKKKKSTIGYFVDIFLDIDILPSSFQLSRFGCYICQLSQLDVQRRKSCIKTSMDHWIIDFSAIIKPKLYMSKIHRKPHTFFLILMLCVSKTSTQSSIQNSLKSER